MLTAWPGPERRYVPPPSLTPFCTAWPMALSYQAVSAAYRVCQDLIRIQLPEAFLMWRMKRCKSRVLARLCVAPTANHGRIHAGSMLHAAPRHSQNRGRSRHTPNKGRGVRPSSQPAGQVPNFGKWRPPLLPSRPTRELSFGL